MFTGIVTDLGVLRNLEIDGDLRVRIGTNYDVTGIDLGASISCDGVCLTVVSLGSDDGNWFDVDISAESVKSTNVKTWSIGRKINLERALRIGDELGGHIVSGHVDGTAEIIAMNDEGGSTRFTFSAPAGLAKFIAPKGSVALNGTSLTVNEVDGCHFGVNIIPHTKEMTTWSNNLVGDLVNLEIDTMARYVARLREFD